MSTTAEHPTDTQHKDQKDNVHNTPNEYPFALYNHKTRQTKAAKDKEDYDKLTKLGFDEKPLEPQDPDALTEDEVKTLTDLLSKAAKALEKLGHLSQADDKNDKASGQKEPAGAARK